jgi:hypothetical protein
MSDDQHGFLAYSASSLAAKKIAPVRSYAVKGLRLSSLLQTHEG